MRDVTVQARHAGGRRPRRGAALVEMAIALPLLVLLTFAAIEYGWMFFRASQVNQAARHGVRIAVRPESTQDDVLDAVASLMTDAGFQSAQYSVAVTDEDGAAISDVSTLNVGDPLKVGVTVPYTHISLTRLIFLPTPDHVYGTATMAKEGPP